jgi:hypothetical protein
VKLSVRMLVLAERTAPSFSEMAVNCYGMVYR